MSNPAHVPVAPKRPARSWLPRSVLIGFCLFVAGGAICGATGVCRTEYTANPGEQAMLVSLMAAPYGLLAGVVFGLLANAIRRRRVQRRQLIR
jgi:hypothetical protein